MQMFWEVFWIIWFAMLIIGDPIANFVYGEKASDTHFIVTHLSVGLRAGVLGWVTYHFLVSHIRS